MRSRVGYKYEPDYSATRSFAVPGGAVLDANPTRNELFLWREEETTVGTLDPATAGFGGWTLDEHHAYDPIDRVLHYGDGTRRSVEGGTFGKDTKNFAGTGEPGYDNEPLAKDARLNGPGGILARADGSVLIADAGNARVRRVGRNGRISTFAGTGEEGSDGDGGPAADGHAHAPDRPRGRARRARSTCSTRVPSACGGSTPTGRSRRSPASWKSRWRSRPAATARSTSPSPPASCGSPPTAPSRRSRATVRPGSPATAARPRRRSCRAGSRASRSVPMARSTSATPATAGIRRVGADGVITTVAGGGDGVARPRRAPGRRRLAALAGRAGCVDTDGTVRFADGTGFVLALGPDGDVARIAGEEMPMPTLASARRAANFAADPSLPWVRGLALAPNGDLLVSDGGAQVLRFASALPGFTDDGISIASEDGLEVYEFSRVGRHLRTVESLSGRVLYRFVYDDAGRLIEVRDAVNDVTRIERAASGAATAIVGPFGKRVTLETTGGMLTGAAGRGRALMELRLCGGRAADVGHEPRRGDLALRLRQRRPAAARGGSRTAARRRSRRAPGAPRP